MKNLNRKNLPLILMLVAGVVTWIITYVQDYSILEKLVSIFFVLLLFYFLGSLLKWTLDYFEEQNEKKNAAEGEVIEKESEEGEGKEEKKEENKEENKEDKKEDKK